LSFHMIINCIDSIVVLIPTVHAAVIFQLHLTLRADLLLDDILDRAYSDS
jgi:hypothetical protein